MYIHIYVYTYIHIYIYTYIYIHTYIYIYTCFPIYPNLYIYMHTIIHPTIWTVFPKLPFQLLSCVQSLWYASIICIWYGMILTIPSIMFPTIMFPTIIGYPNFLQNTIAKHVPICFQCQTIINILCHICWLLWYVTIIYYILTII